MTDLSAFNQPVFEAILARGLCTGVGRADGKMCVEAAISQAMGLPFGDDPACVHPAVRRFKITLNDSPRWESDDSRARGLRDIAVAQLGSDTLDGVDFARRIAEAHIRVLLPTLFRELFTATSPVHQRCREAADRCEKEGTKDAASAAYAAASAASPAADAAASAAYAAAYAAANAADAAAYAAAYAAANAAARAAYAAASAARAAADAASAAGAAGERYLVLSANLCLQVLRDMACPGVELLDRLYPGVT